MCTIRVAEMTVVQQSVMCCLGRGLQGEDGGDVWVLRPGGRIPVEGELRRLMTPDAWCVYESMRRAVLRLKDLGLAGQAPLAAVPPERLRLAFEALPPSPVCPQTPPVLGP